MQITTELLLKRATAEKDKFKVANYHSAELDGDIQVRKVPASRIYELLDESKDEGLAAKYITNLQIIYECCPVFHNSDLIDAYDCVEPYEVVGKVLDDNAGEIGKLISIILDMYGLNEDVEDVKN